MAAKSLNEAIELHQQSGDMAGEACDLQDLGTIQRLQNQRDAALSSFSLALQLHKQTKDVTGERFDSKQVQELEILLVQILFIQLIFISCNHSELSQNLIPDDDLDSASSGSSS
jgi:hypothetical protein